MEYTPPGWTQLYPPCLSIPGFLGYSDDPGIILGWTHPPPCLNILGFLGYSDDPRIIPGWMDTALRPPCLSILGFLGNSDDPGIIPRWTQLYPPPLSEYPGIPGILGRSWDHPRMDTALPSPLSEYPGIPGILGRSWYHPRMDTAHPPCLSILGFLGYSDDRGIIPGWTQLYPPLSCLSIPGYDSGGGGELCPSRDDPRIVRVSQESQDTQTGGGGMSYVHPGMIRGSSEYPRNPRILRQGGGGVSCVHPGMIPGSSEYSRNPRILREGASELCPSRDDPGIIRVSQESQDTTAMGGGG